MNFAGFAMAAALGFVLSIALMDITRHHLAARWPVQRQEGFRIERRLLPWMLALVAGPAILWEQARRFQGKGWEYGIELAVLYALTALWSLCYGTLVLSGFTAVADVVLS
ncbi:hypothetical protein ACU5AY_07890 [Rhizobium sp. PAMB 3174]